MKHFELKSIFKSSCLLMLLLLSFINASFADTSTPKLTDELIQSMQQGGYVIYFRHTETDHDVHGIFPVDFNDCEQQRPLSDKGRKQAISIGRTLKQLNIPIGLVLSSPYCRTMETAMLAFERSESDNSLASSFHLKRTARDKAAAHLQTLLNTTPKGKTNSVIVGHSSNIRDAMSDWPKPEGAMLIYKTTAGDQPTLVALISPQDWKQYTDE